MWLAVLAALAALFVYGLRPISRWRYRHFPGPPHRWLLGQLPEMVAEGQQHMTERLCREYGPGPFCFFLGGRPILMTDTPELARKVLVRPWRHRLFSLQRGEDDKWDQQFMLFSRGAAWKEARNAWQPFFHKDALEKQLPLFTESAARLTSKLGEAADEGREVDVWRSLGEMTLDVVGTAAFGVDFSTLDGSPAEEGASGGGGSSKRRLSAVHTPAARLVGALQAFFKTWGLGNPLLLLLFLFPEAEPLTKFVINLPGLGNAALRKELASRRELRAVGTELVEQARAAAAADSADAPAAAAGGSDVRRPGAVDPGSFLALILPSLGRAVGGAVGVLDESWAANQASGFILAGYETTANALAFTLYLLASNPDKEARLLAEVDGYGRARLPSTIAELDAAFPYVAAAFNEALRLYPPAHTAIREAPPEGMALGGLRVPGTASLQVSTYAMHRSPALWQDPLAFQPERFLPGTPEAAAVVEGAFEPFGAGVRKCIGYRFALAEARLALVILYQRLTFRLCPGQTPLKTVAGLTLSPAGGIRVTVHRR